MENILRDGSSGSTEKIKEALIEVKGSLSDAGRQASTSAKKVMNELGHVSQDAFKDLSEEGKKQLSSMEDYVRENPVKSVLFGAAIGAVISRIIKY